MILSHLEGGIRGLGEKVGPVLHVIYLRSLSPKEGTVPEALGYTVLELTRMVGKNNGWE